MIPAKYYFALTQDQLDRLAKETKMELKVEVKTVSEKHALTKPQQFSHICMSVRYAQ